MPCAKTVAKWIVAILLWIVAVAALAAAIVPSYLDRLYYRGVVSDHFDGSRFFNPDGEDTGTPGRSRGGRAGFLYRQATGNDGRPAWPDSVAVRQGKPPARVTGGAMVVTWIGHATMLVQAGGLNILTDPIWSETAGPFGFGPKRVAQPGVRFADLPKIDLVLVSHNHYDHMDLTTLKRLWARDRPFVVTSLGNDAVIGNAGVSARGMEWGQRLRVKNCAAAETCPQIDVTVTRGHHWGSRWFTDRNRALWSSFVVRLPGGNFYFAGDTGLGDGKWPAEAAALGPIRLAGIPIGAFRFEPGQMGTDSHIGPVDAIRVWQGLGAPFSVPIHWGTFRLSWEGWSTPPKMLGLLLRCAGTDDARLRPYRIGEPVRVPPLGGVGPRVDTARLGRCATSPVVQALD